jgi:hypothetical protein
MQYIVVKQINIIDHIDEEIDRIVEIRLTKKNLSI